jgi:hypothetical protein
MLFKRKQESRFHFAHSVDPIKTTDWDEIEVPATIQDLIERNIRTLSNSISNKSDNENAYNSLDWKVLKERWLTKKEEFLLKNERTTAGQETSINSPRNRGVKGAGEANMSKLQNISN